MGVAERTRGRTRRSGTRGIPWGWLFFGPLLSLEFSWYATDLLSLSVEAYLFLPLLTGWLASRYGPRVAGLLLGLGLLSVFGIVFKPLAYLLFSLGIPLYVYLLSVCSAIAFSVPRLPDPRSSLFKPRWRWLRWVLALGIAVFSNGHPDWGYDDPVEFGVHAGAVLMVAALAASIDREALREWLRRIFPAGEPRWRRVSMLSICVLLGLAFVFFGTLRTDVIEVSFGYAWGMSLLFGLAFALPAFGIVDWRVAVALLIAFFAADWAVTLIGDSIQARPVEPGGVVLGVLPDLVACVSATLLAVALLPFWRHRDPSQMRTARSTLFLFLTLAVLLLGLSATVYGLDGHGRLLAGGIAFAMGLIWRVRGIIAGPLIIQTAFLLSLVPMGDYAARNATQLLDIGLVAFPFAYFGFLSNRYAPGPANVDDKTARLGVEP